MKFVVPYNSMQGLLLFGTLICELFSRHTEIDIYQARVHKWLNIKLALLQLGNWQLHKVLDKKCFVGILLSIQRFFCIDHDVPYGANRYLEVVTVKLPT